MLIYVGLLWLKLVSKELISSISNPQSPNFDPYLATLSLLHNCELTFASLLEHGTGQL